MTAQPLDSRYVLDDRIGQGRTGTVWRGRDQVSGLPRAIRLLAPELAADPGVIARFERERTALLRLRHQNVVTLHDVIIADGQLALVSDLLPDGDLAASRQQAGGALEPAAAAGIAAQLSAGLAATHAGGVVHGDLRPASVLLDGTTARIADAGLTRLAGVPAAASHLAPEVISGQPPSAAADVYAAGVTLYELLAGQPPFGGGEAAIRQAHLEATPVPPAGVPEGLWELVSGCLSKRPAARPTAADLVRALRDPWILRGAAVMMSAVPPVMAATPVAPGTAAARQAAARETAEREAAERAAAEREAAAREAAARELAAREAAARELAAREAAARELAAREAAARELAAREAAARELAARELAAREAAARELAAREAAARQADERQAAGRDAAEHETAAREAAAARYAAVRGAAARELAAHEDAAWQAGAREAVGPATGRHAAGRPVTERESVWFQAAAARQAAALGTAGRADAAPGGQPGTGAEVPADADRSAPGAGDEAETIVPGAPARPGAGPAAGTSLPAITAPLLSAAPGQPETGQPAAQAPAGQPASVQQTAAQPPAGKAGRRSRSRPPRPPSSPGSPQPSRPPGRREGRRRRRMAAFAAVTAVVAVAALVTVIRLGADHATPVADSGPAPSAGADARNQASASPAASHPAVRRPASLSGREAMPAPSPTATTPWRCGPAVAAKLSTGAAAAGVTLQACIRAVHGRVILRGILRGAVTSPAEQLVLVLKNAAQKDLGKPHTSGACTVSACTYMVTVSPGKGQWTVLPKWEQGGTFQSAGRESGFISN